MFLARQEIVNNLNFRDSGPVGSALAEISFDPGLMRPFYDEKGRSCVMVRNGKKKPLKKADGTFVTNSQGQPIEVHDTEKVLTSELLFNGMTKIVQNATVMTKDQWVTLTSIVKEAYRKRLRAWTDLAAASSFGGFDGMSTMALEYQTMSDPGEALMDFDGLSQGRNDQPLFKLEGLPLPITHCDFSFGDRTLAISRARGGVSLNVRMAEAAGRRVAELIEKTLIGVATGPILGDATTGITGHPYGRAAGVYGYLNHPDRLLKTNMTAPTAGGWTPQTLITELLAAIEQLRASNCFGPFMIYHSTDWSSYLNNDYKTSASASSDTLLSRVKEIDEVTDVRRLDYLPSSTNPFTFIIVSMEPDKVQAVTGMDVTTLQWPTMGGLQINFKVMAIKVPLITPDYNGNCGVLIVTTS